MSFETKNYIIRFAVKMPWALRNRIIGLCGAIPNHCKDYDIISLYDQNQIIKADVKDNIVSNNGNIVVGGNIIKCWVSGGYSLGGLKRTKGIHLNDCLSVTKEGLYFQDKLKIEFSPFERDNIFYIDFKEYLDGDKGYYAFRTASRLFVSENLVDWDEIYNKKRGIKNSMLFTKREDEVILIFIEYTPGTIRERHHIIEYSFSNKRISIAKEFFTYSEYLENNSLDCCRHIHVIDRDPFTNDIYVGTGDNDIESAIWVSKDNGKSYNLLYRNGQLGRTLSFMFTEKSIFWTMDSHEPQFIVRYDRNSKETAYFPVVNGALWHSFRIDFDGKSLYLIGSNSEGAHFDNNNRVYGITLEDDCPRVFELTRCKSWTQYDQLFPVYVRDNEVYLYDILGCSIMHGIVVRQ